MKDDLDDTNPFKQSNLNEQKNNNNNKNDLLNEFINENKNRCKIKFKNLNWKKNKICILISIIVSIAIIAILIIIFLFIPKKSFINKEIEKNNTLKLAYYTKEEGTELTLFSPSILPNILSIEIDGKIKEEINNYYVFNSPGEHKVIIHLKKNLISLSNLFNINTYLIEADFSDVETKNVNDTSNMFYKCNNLLSINLANFNSPSLLIFPKCFLVVQV